MISESASNFSGQPHRVSALDACPLRGAVLAMIRFFIVLFALAATLVFAPAQTLSAQTPDPVIETAAETDVFGRYGEAVHTLLFRSIQDIDRNRPNVVRRSLTSREIGSLPVLTPEAQKAFSTIAGVSELAHFGGVSVNKAGFETARKAYADLTGQTPSARRSRR